ncbi:hypothetical protein [Gemmatimonas sp.]|uniref:hypothetical protein n=1 Tax=Gemmatimonas sp. TaxID=1962908 RepID=UPI003F6F02EC
MSRCTPPAIPATDTSPITHADLLTRLRAFAAQTRSAFALERADGTRDHRHLTASQEKRLVSYLSRALNAAGVSAESERCVRVLVPDLATLPTTRAIHTDAPGAVAAALALTFGYRATRRAQLPGGTGQRFLPEPFRPLLAFVRASDSFASQAANLLTTVARVAVAAGAITAPIVMPSSHEMALAAATLNRVGSGRFTRALSVYRSLCARAIADNPAAPFAMVPDGRIERAQGRGLLWTLARLARDGHERADEFLALVAAGDQLAALRMVLPGIAEDLEEYLETPRGERKKRDGSTHLNRTQHDVIDGVCSCAAALLDLGLAAPGDDSVDLESFWTALHSAPATESASNAKMRRRAERRMILTGALTLTVTPVARLVADRLASQSLALSRNAGTGYPQVVANDLWSAWAVTYAVYSDDLEKDEPEIWVRMQAGWLAVRKHMRKRRAAVSSGRTKQKLLGLRAMPTPYVLAFGLPMLAQHARRALVRAQRFIARATELNPGLGWEHDRDARRAADHFADVSLTYLVTALATWVSMRKNQYVHARYGTHVRMVTRHDGMRVIHTEWPGDNHDRARVKTRNSRSWMLPVGAIDLDVWDGYLTLVRAPRLQKRGASVEDAAAPNGLFALFVTDEKTQDDASCFSDTQISRIYFGGGLLWIARNVFGLSELPEKVEHIDRSRWHGVFAVHFVRDLKATYLGTVLGEWGAAEEHTLDEVRTLRLHYAQTVYGASYDAAGWNVSAFDQWSRRALLGSDRVATDALSSPDLRALLPAAARATLQNWQRADREEARKARTTVGRVSGGSTRRRRPGQKPPVSATQ